MTMQLLIKISNIIDRISEFLGTISMYLVLLTVAIGFFNVAARYFDRFRFIESQVSSNVFIELQWYLYSLVFFFGFSYILKNGINVRVDFLYANWPRKRQATVDFIGHLLFLLPFCILGIYVTINPVLYSWGQLPDGTFGTWEMSPDPNGLPRAPIKSMIILAFGMLLLQTIS
ncbi:MAG: TRAP transporter small permease subunit, partial [Anaerolineales bacterium]|nr:TRAP transporter small permease subunit [Anaerolineales bacterium]